MDRKVISVYMGNPDNSNHAELELPATPWELLDALDKLRLEDGQQLYWQVEDMGDMNFSPHILMGTICTSSTHWQRSSVHSAMWMPWPLRA